MIKNLFALKTVITAFILLFCTVANAQSIWSNTITGTNPNTDNPYITGQIVDPNISVSGIGRGTGITGTSANNRYNANSWNTTLLDTAAYFYFIITPNAGYQLNFSDFTYTSQASGTGPTSFAIRSSLDNFTTDIGSPTTTGDTISLTAPSFQNIVSPIEFRIYAWGASSGTGTYSINDFTFNGNAPLPIIFENFTATIKNNSTALLWKLGGTNKGEKIAIQHSTDGKNFVTLKTLDQTINSFTHHNPAKGNNYYRLGAIHTNGSIHYTAIQSVFFGSDQHFTVYPNPAKDVLHVPYNNLMNVKIYSIAGELMMEAKHTENNSINIKELSNGAYTINAILPDGAIVTQTFIVVK